jgi:putative flippase GtrA
VKFVGLGAIAALVNFASRFAFGRFMPYEAAVVCAYLLGMVVAFVLFQKFVFGDAGNGQFTQIFRFTLVNIVGLIVAVATSSILARVILPAIGWTFLPYTMAHLVGITAPTITSYFGHKFFTYRQTFVETR